MDMLQRAQEKRSKEGRKEGRKEDRDIKKGGKERRAAQKTNKGIKHHEVTKIYKTSTTKKDNTTKRISWKGAKKQAYIDSIRSLESGSSSGA